MSAGSAIVEGAFVRAFFPTSEKPREPGLLHICYCLAVRPPLVLVAYTTKQPWPADQPLPPGVRVFGAGEAAALNQRAFVLYLNRQARLPLTPAWFPDLHRPGQGVVAIADAPLREELYQTVLALHRRRKEAVRLLGP